MAFIKKVHSSGIPEDLLASKEVLDKSKFHQVQIGVQSDRIRIGYCIYHIQIRTQPSDTDTDIDRCEKMIMYPPKLDIEYKLDADINWICKNGHGNG